MNLKNISYFEKVGQQSHSFFKGIVVVSVLPQIFWTWSTFSSIGTSFERSNHAARLSALIESLSEHLNHLPHDNKQYLSKSFRRSQLDLVKMANDLPIQSPQFRELLTLHKEITKLLEELNTQNRKAKVSQISNLTLEYSRCVKNIISDYETKIRQKELELQAMALLLFATIVSSALLFSLGEIRKMNVQPQKDNTSHPSKN